MKLVVIHGANISTPRVCRRASWLYGSRDDHKPYGDVFMLDYHWQGHSIKRWSRYLKLIDQYKPTQAVCMDFERPSQAAQMHVRINHIKARGVMPIIVPKFEGAVSYIPPVAIIGISVPTDYAGFLPQVHEVQGRDLHLLGGMPDQWKWLIGYYRGANVVSIDGNKFMRSARSFGRIWSRYGYERERGIRGCGFSDEAIAIVSLRNARRYLDNDFMPSSKDKRIKDCMRALGLYDRQLALAI